MLELWGTIEERAGIAVDSRVAAVLASDDSAITALLPSLTERTQRFVALSTLLWPRGPELARASVEVPNRFQKAPIPDIYGLNVVLGEHGLHRVDVTQDGWRTRADAALADAGTVILFCALSQRSSMHVALLSITSQPTETGVLQTFPRIDGIQTIGGSLSVRVYLGEHW
jgi:hypothetical protein